MGTMRVCVCARAGKGQPLLEVCKGLLAQFGVRPEQYQIGRTRLFFRAGVLGQLEDAAVRINKCVQGAWLPGGRGPLCPLTQLTPVPGAPACVHGC